MRDRADLVDEFGVVGEGEHDHLLAGVVAAQFDVGAIVHQLHTDLTVVARLDEGPRVRPLAANQCSSDCSLLK
jgi:hypothetical protein